LFTLVRSTTSLLRQVHVFAVLKGLVVLKLDELLSDLLGRLLLVIDDLLEVLAVLLKRRC